MELCKTFKVTLTHKGNAFCFVEKIIIIVKTRHHLKFVTLILLKHGMTKYRKSNVKHTRNK